MPYGWDAMDLTEEDKKSSEIWILNTAHSVPPHCPLCCTYLTPTIRHAMPFAGEVVCEPTSKSWDWRLHNGYWYVIPILPHEDEIPAREVRFREYMAPVVDDPWGYYEKLIAGLMQMEEPLMRRNLEQMNDGELFDNLMDCCDIVWKAMRVHMLAWVGLACGIILFRGLCQELLGISPADVTYAKLMSGRDSAVLKLNRRVAELATKAIELKLDDNFKLPEEEVLPAMEQSDAGREWLKSLSELLDVFGLRMVRQLETNTPTWREKPSLVVPEVRRLMAVGGVHAPDLQLERLVKEREEIEKELLSKVPAEQREWFEKLMRVAQAGHYCSEDHCFSTEWIGFALLRLAYMGIAKRLVKAGVLDDPEDIHLLRHDQVLTAAIPQERTAIRRWVNSNREEWHKYLSMKPGSDEVPMFFGDIAALGKMALVDSLFSIVTAPPIAKAEEVGATCVGASGAPGVVEGIARVIMDVEELGQIQPGEILVTPSTNVNWTPVFGILKGVVTDMGGALAHAAIVSREYGIPAVVGTMDATRKIKTGDRIRVDGNLLRVYVLESSKE